MHPVIRVLCVICLAGLLARPDAFLLLACGVLVLAAGVAVRISAAGTVRVIRRLRYLFLIIVVLYGWATPGTPLMPAAGSLSPTVEGLANGCLHVLALMVLVTAVQVLLMSTEQGLLIAALRWWFRPLGLVGLSADRSALRLVLAMQAVPRIGRLVSEQLDAAGSGLRRWRQLPALAGDLFEKVLADADSMRPGPVQVPELPPPALWQWLPPALLLAALLLIRP